MTIALLAALVVALIADKWVTDRKDRRHDQQVNRLLQRIQAPERAVIEHTAPQGVELPDHVGFDDDFEFWKARGIEVPE